ncbi:MAG: baseplate J/gp47 family protein [Desulfovibrionaceae bacterium]|nr:baseplate J/gp47 family protein [Desulfovibrionaceae bacterium]
MPDFLRPTLSELDARVRNDLTGMPAVLREPLSHAWARTCHGLHGHLDWIDRQCSPLTCELERLYDWAALYGVEQLPATHAVGNAIATGSPGAVIFADTLLRGPNGQDYRVLSANFMGNSSTARVSIRSVEPGDAANLPSGAKLTLIDPLSDISGKLIVDEDGVTGGAAEESVDDWRLRVADEWQAMTVRGARGGRPEDYKYWCMSAHPSVSGALVGLHTFGLGTVVVRPICDGAINRQPPPGVLAAISEYLAAVAPATADWRLASPVVRPVDLILHLDPSIDTASTRDRVAAAVLAAVLAEKMETSILNLAEIDSAIATVTNKYTRIAPVADIHAQPNEVLVLAGIEWR